MKTPIAHGYVKILRLFLYPLGAWPGEVLCENIPLPLRIYRRISPFVPLVSLIGQINYLCYNYKTITLLSFGDAFISIFLTIQTTIRLSLPLFENYGLILSHYLNNFHLSNFQHQGSYYKQIYFKIERFSNYFAKYTIFNMIAGSLLYNLIPLYNSYKNGAFSANKSENVTVDLSVKILLPGFNPENAFIAATLINYYLSYICAVSVVAIDLMVSLMVFQIFGHVLILLNNFEKLNDSNMGILDGTEMKNQNELYCETFEAEKNVSIKKQLSQCTDHHLFIVDFTANLSGFFGLVLGINYLVQLVLCCLLLIECSVGDLDVLIRFGVLTIIMFGQLVQTSVIFEVVKTVSDRLPSTVYATAWERMDIANQQSICIILRRMQTPITVTALGMFEVGLQTMIKVLKTIFSYYTFLKTIDL